jgi:hypothetical protein
MGFLSSLFVHKGSEFEKGGFEILMSKIMQLLSTADFQQKLA